MAVPIILILLNLCVLFVIAWVCYKIENVEQRNVFLKFPISYLFYINLFAGFNYIEIPFLIQVCLNLGFAAGYFTMHNLGQFLLSFSNNDRFKLIKKIFYINNYLVVALCAFGFMNNGYEIVDGHRTPIREDLYTYYFGISMVCYSVFFIGTGVYEYIKMELSSHKIQLYEILSSLFFSFVISFVAAVFIPSLFNIQNADTKIVAVAAPCFVLFGIIKILYHSNLEFTFPVIYRILSKISSIKDPEKRKAWFLTVNQVLYSFKIIQSSDSNFKSVFANPEKDGNKIVISDEATIEREVEARSVEKGWEVSKFLEENQTFMHLMNRCAHLEGQYLKNLELNIAFESIFRHHNVNIDNIISENTPSIAILDNPMMFNGYKKLVKDHVEKNESIYGLPIVVWSPNLIRALDNIEKSIKLDKTNLILGSDGVGKTTLAKAVFNKLGVKYHILSTKIDNFIQKVYELNDDDKGLIIKDYIHSEHKDDLTKVLSNEYPTIVTSVNSVEKHEEGDSLEMFKLFQNTTYIDDLAKRKEDIFFQSIYFASEMSDLIDFSSDKMENLLNSDLRKNTLELKYKINRLSFNQEIESKASSVVLLDNNDEDYELENEYTPLEASEKKIILKTLKDFNGNKAKTHKLLGISLNTLKTKMAKYGIDPKDLDG